MVADPQGAPFYVMKPIPPAGRSQREERRLLASEQQRVGWNELSTSDVEGARRFYGDQFGWGSEEYMDMGEMGLYLFSTSKARALALCSTQRWAAVALALLYPGPVHLRCQGAAERSGGTIHMGPQQVPTGEYVVIGSDPQGAEFALVGRGLGGKT